MKLKLIESPSIIEHPDGQRVAAIFPSRPFWVVGGTNLPKAISDLEKKDWMFIGQKIEPSAAKISKNYQQLAMLLKEAGVLIPDEPNVNQHTLDIEPNVQLNDVEIILIISLTEGCNLACPHCYANGGTRRKDEMTTEQVFEVIQQVTELPWAAEVSSIGLIGGEPLLRQDILNITDRIHELGYEIVLSTNAVLLKDEHIEHFRKYGEKIKISISLDGASSNYHDLIRGSGNFDRTVSAIKKLIAANVPTGINSFIHQGNFENLSEIFALVESLGVRSLNLNTLMYVGRGLEEQLKPVSRSILYRRIFELAVSNPKYLKLIEKSNFANKVIAVAGGFKSKYCGIGSNRALYVRSDGILYPCGDTCISEFQLANLKEQRLAEVWNDSKKLKELRRLNIDTMNPNCAVCDVRYYCAGDCRGENYQQTGEFTAPHFKCKEIRESVLEIIWMLSECPTFLRERTNEVVQKARNVSSNE